MAYMTVKLADTLMQYVCN